IRDPLLANVKIDVTGASDIRLTKQYPSALPDLFKGEQLLIAGRYTGSGKALLRLTGTVNGKTKTFTEKIEFPEKDSDHEFIPRLWANRRVGALLDEIRLNGENKELRDEITELARQYGIVTPYTAYLIMEDEAVRGIAPRAQTIQAAPEVRRQLDGQYREYLKSKSGELAVDAARNNKMLNRSENVDSGANYRYFPSPMMSAPASANARPMAAKVEPKSPEQQATRFANGRAFYQNGPQWIDNNLQKASNTTTNRIQFNSDAYFAFAAKNPSLNPILSLGSNIQFVHNNQIIDIHE
ncbi:MAG TPA: hypothetical protein VM680_17510, partial [Verrucomicrobiae bacterium]|nr:hypothetical protein [Verrucomicrobiae bacterium]